MQITVIGLVAGAPIVIVLSWYFEFGLDRVVLDTNPTEAARPQRSKVDLILIAFFSVALMVSVYFNFQQETLPSQALEISENSIAILPFANLSLNDEDAYLSDGISDEILNSLATIPDLRVPGRTSSFSFRNSDVDLKTIGRRLHVSKILEGSVQRSGNQLRISVQLIDAVEGYQLWSERYDREITDIFEIQDDIASNIVARLKITLAESAEASSRNRPVENIKAYTLFLKGKYHVEKYSKSEIVRGIAYFNESLKLQPDFARAYAWLAFAQSSLRFFGYEPPGAVTPLFRSAVEQALAFDDTLADAQFSLAVLKYNVDWDWIESERAFERALELDPSNAAARGLYSFLLATLGRFEDALKHANKARELEPLSATSITQLGWIHFFAGHYEQSIESANDAIEFEPEFANAHELRGYALFRMGEYSSGIEATEKAVNLAYFPLVMGNLGWMYANVGRTSDAEDLLNTLKQLSQEKYVPAAPIATIYAGLGRYDEADIWMSKAIGDREGSLVLLPFSWGSDDPENPYFSEWLRRTNRSSR